jgi:hypothetical protein
VWNERGLAGQTEVILTEALIDAMTFWCAGYRNVTAAYGVEGLTDDHLATFKRLGVRRVLIAFDRDDAGERGAEKAAERLMAEGIECYRVQFPKGMDANEYALKVTPPDKSLGLLIRKAVWLGKGAAPAEASGQHVEDVALPPEATSPADVAPAAETPSLAAEAAAPALPADVDAQVNDDEVVMSFGDRRYRVRGLAKNLSAEVLKVNVLASQGEAYHVDSFDLYAARARAHYITQAAKELACREDVIKLDLGRILLKLEALQAERIRGALTREPAAPKMTAAEEAEALALLKTPDLLTRIVDDFDACGLVGEATNKLVGYLAATSRKLGGPLAIVVQSSSAAGKSSLMDAVLAFMPEEERIKYSAMTGQSLFYMGETNLKHKILAIAEEEGASRASYALKLLQSEGELHHRQHGQGRHHRQPGDAAVPRRGAGDDLPDHHGHRDRRRAVEPLHGAQRGRGARADRGHPSAAARQANAAGLEGQAVQGAPGQAAPERPAPAATAGGGEPVCRPADLP